MAGVEELGYLPRLVVMSTICPPLRILHGRLWQMQKARGMQRWQPLATPQLSATLLVALFESPASRVGHDLSCACARPPLRCMVCRR